MTFRPKNPERRAKLFFSNLLMFLASRRNVSERRALAPAPWPAAETIAFFIPFF